MQMPQWVTPTTLLTVHIGRLQQERLHPRARGRMREEEAKEQRRRCAVFDLMAQASLKFSFFFTALNEPNIFQIFTHRWIEISYSFCLFGFINTYSQGIKASTARND